jgi:indolepyruvate ferredoxin oxidoreductase
MTSTTLTDPVVIDRDYTLEHKYLRTEGRIYLTGIQALVRLPLMQRSATGRRASTPPASCPATGARRWAGLDQALWKAQHTCKRTTSCTSSPVNEDLAATAVWGTQQVNCSLAPSYDGVFAMWYGKGPGVDRSLDDVFKHANAAGTAKHGGVLFVAGDDHACKSSTLPHQSEHVFIGAIHAGAEPGRRAGHPGPTACSAGRCRRYSGCWVGFKAITENGGLRDLGADRPDRMRIVTPRTTSSCPPTACTSAGRTRRWTRNCGCTSTRCYAALATSPAPTSSTAWSSTVAAPRLGIITTGKAYLDVLQALEDLGIDKQRAAEIGLRVYKVGMSWPLEPIA